jgi:hypothetical protein
LTDGFQKRQALDVTDGAADFDDDHIHALVGQADGGFDLVRNVRNDLHRSPEVVPPAFLLDHRVVDFTRRKIIVLSELGMGEPFVMPQIEVRLRTVVGHVDFTVLEGIHRAGIHIDIRIQFLNRYRQSPAFQQRPDGRRGQPFSQRR